MTLLGISQGGTTIPKMKTTTKLLSRIEEQEKSIIIRDMMALADLKAVLDRRIDLRNTCRTLRAVLQG